MNASRDMREMILSKQLYGLNELLTEFILQYANLDLVFYRRGVDFKRHLRIWQTTWTSIMTLHEHYDMFENYDRAMEYEPLTFLCGIHLNSTAIARNILKDVPSFPLCVFDVIATFLLKTEQRCYAGRTAFVQSRDYVQSWWQRNWMGCRAFLQNEITGEIMDSRTLEDGWVLHKFRGSYWWLESRTDEYLGFPQRWFWDPG